MVKGVQREIPLAGVWGYPPATLIPPLLEERGSGGEVNGDGDTPQVIASRMRSNLILRLSTLCVRLLRPPTGRDPRNDRFFGPRYHAELVSASPEFIENVALL